VHLRMHLIRTAIIRGSYDEYAEQQSMAYLCLPLNSRLTVMSR